MNNQVTTLGTNHLADQISARDVMVHTIDTIVAKVRYNLWELQRGELGTIADFRRDMESALIDELVTRAFNLTASVWASWNSGANYTDASATGITESNLRTMMETILTNAGNVRAIVGTRKALLPLYASMGVVEHLITGGTAPTNTAVIGIQSYLEQWKRQGSFSTFNGAPLIELPQILKHTSDGFTTKLIPEDKVLVIGDDAGDIVLYGGVNSQEHTDTSIEPADYSLALWRSFGFMVTRPENVGIIKVA